jgi:hypothetical protein
MGRVDAIAQSMVGAHALSTVEIPPIAGPGQRGRVEGPRRPRRRLSPGPLNYGWDDLIFTHLSRACPGPEHHFLLNPYNLMFEEVTASSLVKVDMSGNPVEPTPFITNAAGLHHPFGAAHGARGRPCGDPPAHARTARRSPPMATG